MKQIKLTINDLLNNEIQLINKNEKNNMKNSYKKYEEIDKESLFEIENNIHEHQSEIVKFEDKYLVKASKINELKNEYRIENNDRILDKDNNLIYTTRFSENNKDINKYHFLKDKNILIIT